MIKLVSIALLFAACTSTTMPAHDAPDPDPNVYAVTWAQSGRSDSIGVPDPVTCTTTISHPCPFLLYTTSLTIAPDGSTFTWGDAHGGTDGAGVSAENRLPWVDPQTFATDGALELEERGDDGGLRFAAKLEPTADGGWAGSATWALFTVAGKTTFDVTIKP